MSKTIIVTGASRGLGLAISKYLLTTTPPNNIIALARSAEPLQALKAEFPHNVEYIAGDLTDQSISEKAVELALTKFSGKLDGLVLNHGVLGQVAVIEKADTELWKEGFDVNLFSLVAFTKAALPALRKSHGKVIFTSSGAAVSATTGWALYGATKAALNYFALALSQEEPDVTCVSVRPGMVDTEMQREIREDHAKKGDVPAGSFTRYEEAHRDGKLLKPEQPGNVMARLVLDAPKELSGRFISWNDKDLAAFQD
ncbi:short-chain dehydrogenase/reductase, putative [Talaromyces stipitatus ATCC 10500]|uniref:Short-chain dehydrogenase/reductase, putative n=1 Tax=Talaromyces stipitatus (strain ATCC 10500 / CBS 375.48 / QM 6759 / NRRL 1006) TaxID=441959 RepID=B8MNY0_TALSN|nr:short-chain dehydrogenase/reductase, putative [Talaromyces stipitatus ATCC 10500]EED14219.1 short-chain dehydrogenase/reductase, putative [Talaromyces stipitatus ATCC 10500]